MRLLTATLLFTVTLGNPAWARDLKGFRGEACAPDETTAQNQLLIEIEQKHSCGTMPASQTGGWSCKKRKLASCASLQWICVTQYACGSAEVGAPATPADKPKAETAKSAPTPMESLRSLIPAPAAPAAPATPNTLSATAPASGSSLAAKAPEGAASPLVEEFDYPAMPVADQGPCLKLAEGILACEPGQCSRGNAVKGLLTMVVRRKSNGGCEYFETQNAPAGTAEASERKSVVSTCDVTSANQADLGNHLRFIAQGGKIKTTACSAKYKDTGCTITREGQTFHDFVEYGLLQGYCSRAIVSASPGPEAKADSSSAPKN